MNVLIKSLKSVLFHFRWLFMSADKKYAYLWGKTRKLNDLGYTFRHPAVVPNK